MRISWVLLVAMGCGKSAPPDSAGATIAHELPAPPAYCGASPCPCAHGKVSAQGLGADFCELGETTTIQGVRCARGAVKFHPDGALDTCEADGEHVVIDGHRCRTSPMAWRVHANRRLALCQDTTPFKIGELMADGRVVDLRDDGTIRNVTFGSDVEVQFGAYWCRNAATLYHDGSVAECDLARFAERPGIPMPPGSSVTFTRHGSLMRLTPSADVTIGGALHHAGELVCFDLHEKPDDRDSQRCPTLTYMID